MRVITCPAKRYMVIHPSRQALRTLKQRRQRLTVGAACVRCRLDKGRALLQILEDYGVVGPSASLPPPMGPASLPSTSPSPSGNRGGEAVPGTMGERGMDLDFVLVVGDERTDEDMFNILWGSTGFAIRNGKGSNVVASTARGCVNH